MADFDPEYPSPLIKVIAYSGELARLRQFDPPPRPADEYPLTSNKDDDLKVEYEAWVDRQVKKDIDGFRQLAQHYKLDSEAPDFYPKLALHLARAHVKGFRMKGKSGRSGKWTEQAYALLQVQVIEKQAEGKTVADALSELESEYRTTGLERRLEQARAFSRESEARYKPKHFEQIRGMPLEIIQAVREKVELLADAAAKEEAAWLDK